MKKEILTKFLSELVIELNNLSDSDLKRLESGEYTLGLKVLKKNSTQNTIKEHNSINSSDVLKELSECKSREQGFKLLQKYFKNKKDLEWFAKEINIYVMKQDKVEKVKEKIIEGTVGATLRSSAIQERDT